MVLTATKLIALFALIILGIYVLKGFICENCDIERPHDADTKTFEIEIGEK